MRHHALRPLVVGLLLALPASACGGSVSATSGPAPGTGPPTSPGTASPRTPAPTTTSTTPGAPVTTLYTPSAPQSSATAAADALLAAWQRGDRQAAATLAAPAAVDALFAVPGRTLQPRGCSDGQPPISCSFADRSAAGHFYVVDADQSGPGHWYVTAVQVS